MKHLDLFSGIGGFSLALDQVIKAEHVFCDNDPFCQEVLKKNFPNTKIYGDIKQITNEPADLVTGGFPCQPFSQAGKRRGTADDRYLWPEMFRVIQLAKPSWVIAENVSGILTWDNGMVLEQVCLDLESEGYEVQPLIIPACAKNAPHRRDRVWILGYSQHNGLNGTKDQKGNLEGINNNKEGTQAVRQPKRTDSLRDVVTDSIISRSRGNYAQTKNKRWFTSKNRTTGLQSRNGQTSSNYTQQGNFNASDTKRTGYKGQVNQTGSSAGYSWDDNWFEVATDLCRVDDGLPRRLDRNPRLKSLGNAIVPQVAEEIMKGIFT